MLMTFWILSVAWIANSEILQEICRVGQLAERLAASDCKLRLGREMILQFDKAQERRQLGRRAASRFQKGRSRRCAVLQSREDATRGRAGPTAAALSSSDARLLASPRGHSARARAARRPRPTRGGERWFGRRQVKAQFRESPSTSLRPVALAWQHCVASARWLLRRSPPASVGMDGRSTASAGVERQSSTYGQNILTLF